jgi:hypothetical protein
MSYVKNQLIEIHTVLDNVKIMLTASSTFLSDLDKIQN